MGRDSVAARARRQSAGAAAAGQGAVAEPAVAAAQPAPVPTPEPVTAPTEDALALEQRREAFFQDSTFKNIIRLRQGMNDIKMIERLYDNKTDAVTLLHGREIGERFRTVADGTMLARDAASQVYERLGFTGRPQRRTESEALASLRLNRGVTLALSAAERLKRMGKLKSDPNNLATTRLAESSRELRQAFELITDSARLLNLRFARPLKLEG